MTDNTIMPAWLWVLTLVLVITLIVLPNVVFMVYNQPKIYDSGDLLSHDGDFDYRHSLHNVKFHITPEQENLTVSIRMQLTSDLVFYHTDNKSEFVAELIPSEKYQIWVHDRNYSLYLYPAESEYYIDTAREG